MNTDSIQLAVFLAITATIAGLTWWRCRVAPRSEDPARDYFLAGGGLAWPVVAGSLLLTNVSAEQIVGMNGAQAMLIAWWELGAVAGLLVLAHVLVPMYYRHGCTTTTELLERRLGDAGLRRLVSALFLLGYMFILLPVVLYTGAVFMKSAFALDASLLAIATAFALGGLAYAFFGGLRAIAISDTFNGVALLLMGAAVTVFALRAVGWDLSGIPAERWTLIGDDRSDIPWHTLLTGMAFIHIFYWGTNMVIAQRAMAARSVREAQKGIYAAIACKLVMPLVVVFPGVIAFKLYGDVGDVAYGRLVADVLPPWLAGAFAAMIVGAVLSSFNSCLNSAAALWTCDFHLARINRHADVKRVGQAVTVAFTAVALAMVPLYEHAQSIIATLQQLNGLYSMPVLAAFIAAVYFAPIGAHAVKLGIAFGAGLYALFTFLWSPLHYIHLMAVTLAASLLVMLGADRLARSQRGRLASRRPAAAGAPE